MTCISFISDVVQKKKKKLRKKKLRKKHFFCNKSQVMIHYCRQVQVTRISIANPTHHQQQRANAGTLSAWFIFSILEQTESHPSVSSHGLHTLNNKGYDIL